LTISALNPADTRTLTVEYYGEADNAVMKAIGPFLAVFIIGGLHLQQFIRHLVIKDIRRG